MSRTVIYGKDDCPYTLRARQHHAEHTYHDVIREPERLQEMLQYSDGRRRVPVIVVDGQASVGFKGS